MISKAKPGAIMIVQIITGYTFLALVVILASTCIDA